MHAKNRRLALGIVVMGSIYRLEKKNVVKNRWVVCTGKPPRWIFEARLKVRPSVVFTQTLPLPINLPQNKWT